MAKTKNPPAAKIAPAAGKHLGRVAPIATYDVGRFRVIERKDGSFKVVPRFAAHYALAFDVAPPPVTTDWIAKCQAAIATMLGNDTKGDCVIASLLHQIGSWTGNESGAPVISNTTEALANYAKICGPGDQGCEITAVLDYAKTNGFPAGGKDHFITNYVSIDNKNQNEVQVAVELFGSAVKIGFNCPQSYQDLATGNGFLWPVPTDPSIGGHDVPIIDVQPKGAVIATWAMWGVFEWAALACPIVDECYAILSPDWTANNDLAPNGVVTATLVADLALLGEGTIPPIGVPPGPVVPPIIPPPIVPPVPPTPTPTPTPVSPTVARIVTLQVDMALLHIGVRLSMIIRANPQIYADALAGMTADQIVSLIVPA